MHAVLETSDFPELLYYINCRLYTDYQPCIISQDIPARFSREIPIYVSIYRYMRTYILFSNKQLATGANRLLIYNFYTYITVIV